MKNYSIDSDRKSKPYNARLKYSVRFKDDKGNSLLEDKEGFWLYIVKQSKVYPVIEKQCGKKL